MNLLCDIVTEEKARKAADARLVAGQMREFVNIASLPYRCVGASPRQGSMRSSGGSQDLHSGLWVLGRDDIMRMWRRWCWRRKTSLSLRIWSRRVRRTHPRDCRSQTTQSFRYGDLFGDASLCGVALGHTAASSREFVAAAAFLQKYHARCLPAKVSRS